MPVISGRHLKRKQFYYLEWIICGEFGIIFIFQLLGPLQLFLYFKIQLYGLKWKEAQVLKVLQLLPAKRALVLCAISGTLGI